MGGEPYGGKSIVLVTGVAGYLGNRLAERMLREPLTSKIEGLDLVQADVCNPLLAELLETEGADTVCHLAFVETARPSKTVFDLNVNDTVKLLKDCIVAVSAR